MNESALYSFPIEMINVIPCNPLISHCQIKVCWVGEEPNRNKSIITKEVATELANSLPGSPIVGYYNENAKDFEGHNRVLEISGGEVKLRDTTRPYGFVDLNAKVWFQKFQDDDGVVREYLVTEGYLWTGQYPEAQRIIKKGNNQSMELDEEIIDAYWTKDNKGNKQFFIINEAIISKLCILGESIEPCFEGSRITSFSLSDNFKNQLFSLVNQMKEILEEGGVSMDTSVENIIVEDSGIDTLLDTPEVETPEVEIPMVEEPAAEEPAAEPQIEEPAEEQPEAEIPTEEPEALKYSLEEIPEYNELLTRYSALETSYAALETEMATLKATNEVLTKFKNSVEKKEKESMINSFYMLSDDDKKDVIDNIDSYSLDEIEAKLSIICVRNRVNFSLEEDNNKEEQPTTYNLENDSAEELVPAWIKAIHAVANKK